jgi:predicted acylesterase/phospholipase RssA
MNTPNNNPNNIALALSGGGYRAAAFHLGTMDFLARIGMLEKVTMLSTVSGATITGAKYALSLSEGKSFQQFCQELYHFLANTNLPNLWLKKDSSTRQEPNLIVKAATIYHKLLFQGRGFKTILDQPTHLQEIIFNATELSTGLGFRLQKSNSNGIIGNGNYRVSQDILEGVALGDVVAASSCFPGGFEPILFPDDFTWLEGKSLEDIQSQLGDKFNPPLALIDGGIYDNQGVEALLLVDERLARQQKSQEMIDILIISDTDNIQPGGSMFSPAEREKKAVLPFFTLARVTWLAGLTLFAAVLSTVWLGWRLLQSLQGQVSWFNIFTELVPLVFSIAIAAIIIKVGLTLMAKIRRLLKELRIDGQIFWLSIRELTIPQLLDFIQVRILSLLGVSAAFMKRNRRLIYDQVFKLENYKNKRIANLIYQIQDSRTGNSLTPTREMVDLSEFSTEVGTTLWFSEDPYLAKKQLDSLIACGQITMCYNWQDYVLKVYGTDSSLYPPVIKDFFAKAEEIWAYLQTDCFRMLR